MEGCTLNEICASNFGVRYNDTKSSSFFEYWKKNLESDESSMSLNMSDIDYRVEKIFDKIKSMKYH